MMQNIQLVINLEHPKRTRNEHIFLTFKDKPERHENETFVQFLRQLRAFLVLLPHNLKMLQLFSMYAVSIVSWYRVCIQSFISKQEFYHKCL